jgi:RNA polymerase sigma-70 factor (ECF subfamily)
MKQYSVIEVLYKDYNKFYAFALSLLKNKHLAEDVVQDVFLQLLSSNSNHLLWIFDKGKGISYINKIIAVRCLSKKSQFYKQQVQYVKSKINVSEQELEYLYNKLNTESISLSKVLRQKIKNVIDGFDEYEKNLFLLYYESGMTYTELSKEIGIPKISIYNTVRKVKKQIKKQL